MSLARREPVWGGTGHLWPEGSQGGLDMGLVEGGLALAPQKSREPLSRTLGSSPAEHSCRTPLLEALPVGDPPTPLVRTAPGALREHTDCYPPALCWPLLHQERAPLRPGRSFSVRLVRLPSAPGPAQEGPSWPSPGSWVQNFHSSHATAL